MTTMQADECLCETRAGPCLVQRVADHTYICLHTLKQHSLAAFVIDAKSRGNPVKERTRHMDQRIAADRLWRDEASRRQFESDSGMSPLAETEAEQQAQIASGHMQNYHEKFCGWAAKKLGLPYISPATVREFTEIEQ